MQKKSTTFHTVALMGKPYEDTNLAGTLQLLIDYLQQYDTKVVIEEKTGAILPQCKLPLIPGDQLGKVAKLLIVIGGDGSLLHAARLVASQNLAVLGVNRGRLGFLADILPDSFDQLDSLMEGKYIAEGRFLLQTEVDIKEEKKSLSLALNDVVIMTGEVGHMAEFIVMVDENFVCQYRCDGLIVATPTGSTAYALSGGGPILYPGLDVIGLVPMFSHNLSSRPIVLKGDSKISVIAAPSNRQTLTIICDGQKCSVLPPGESVKICKSKTKLLLLHPKTYDYFATLRSKLNWEKEL